MVIRRRRRRRDRPNRLHIVSDTTMYCRLAKCAMVVETRADRARRYVFVEEEGERREHDRYGRKLVRYPYRIDEMDFPKEKSPMTNSPASSG